MNRANQRLEARMVDGADEKPPAERTAGGSHTVWTVRGLLLVQVAIFLSLVSIHFGVPVGGYRNQAAGTTELLFAAVLLAGLLLTWAPPPWDRRAATLAQSFGVLGVLVGLFTVVLAIRPWTILDLALNVALLLALVSGLVMTKSR